MITWHTLELSGIYSDNIQYNYKMHVLNGINGVLAIQINSYGVIWCLKYDNRYDHKPLLPCFVSPHTCFVDGELLTDHFGWLTESYNDLPVGYRAWYADCHEDENIKDYLEHYFSIITQVCQRYHEIH